jgi:hypothetical protein
MKLIFKYQKTVFNILTWFSSPDIILEAHDSVPKKYKLKNNMLTVDIDCPFHMYFYVPCVLGLKTQKSSHYFNKEMMKGVEEVIIRSSLFRKVSVKVK